ncbi:MAG TPA: hypothetical protein PLJ35_05090 [Anaerolineae bacterium]|nr:hypothetical protein [Anaerolineae bacterium]
MDGRSWFVCLDASEPPVAWPTLLSEVASHCDCEKWLTDDLEALDWIHDLCREFDGAWQAVCVATDSFADDANEPTVVRYVDLPDGSGYKTRIFALCWEHSDTCILVARQPLPWLEWRELTSGDIDEARAKAAAEPQ